jgi:hypothetical protein
MLVKTYYSTGHFDVFDTVTLVDGSIFRENALTNYSLEISDARAGKALWLNCYYYEADGSYRNDLSPHGLPIARRRDGWAFVIADEADLEILLKVSVDGEDVLVRQGDEFVDALKLKIASEMAYSVNPASVSTHDYYQVAARDQDPCERIGYSQSAYGSVVLIQRRAEVPEDSHDSTEGAANEDRFSIR